MEEPEQRRRLEALFRGHAEAVHAYALRRSDTATADDVVSEVFAVACRRLDDIPDEALPWLLACARRVLANHRRGARRLDALRGRLAGSWREALPAERGDGLLRMAINQLSERDREVLLLSAWEGLSPVELAAVLGCSRTAAATRLHRARKRLETALERLERPNSRSEPMEALR
jgi:RNA polymerase sigma-70 factor, ECF subfamily